MPGNQYQPGEKVRVISEQELKDSQARLSGIIASAMDAIITLDEQLRIVLFNHSAENVFGYPFEAVAGKPIDLLLPERYREIHRDHIRRFAHTGVTNRAMGRLGRLYGLRSNNEEFPLEASISQVETSEGKLFTVILRDITDRVKIEESLRENEDYLRATFDLAAVGISHQSTEGNWLRVNRRLCEITGYTESELTQMTYIDITPPEDLEGDFELRRNLYNGSIESFTREKRYIRKDGSLIWVSVSGSVIRDLDSKPKYVITITEDIHTRKLTEEALQAKNNELSTMTQQLWHTARLATMGELAASVAHELNNPLAILSLRVESLRTSVEPGSSESRELKVMEQEIDRMASLVANLLQFSRPGQRQISTLDLKDEMTRTLELIRNYMVNRGIRINIDIRDDLPLVQADRQQLRQLFLNLLTNAVDAMPQGGDLSIHMSREDKNRSVMIQIQDSGTGISPENLPKVLDPFFSTKPSGKGTGLGLAICKRIIDDHHGVLTIRSPGIDQGTTVQINLPIINEAKPIIFDD